MSEITSVINEHDLSHKQINLRRIRVEVLDGPDQGKWAEFDHDVVRIGAQEGNHFRITDSTVSRRHAEITRTRDGLVLRDLGSTNGTFVGAVRIREVYLGENRRFRVGKTEMEFTLKDELVDIVPAKETRFEGLVGQSRSLREVFSVLERVARTELTVLVTGETGTGKELVSRALHQRSNRKNGPFIVFDCGAIPANLVESELFGHERGAFTGAVSSRAGVFEQAHGGTIFLDELGELPLELQPNLLRVLEQREVRRVGDTRTRAVDVRVVAATNRDLQEMVREGRFREDLYYRLNVVEVKLPPLRERAEDLPMLVEHIIKHAPFEHSVRGCTDDVLRLFCDYHWPGNIRELKNTVLRCIPFCDGDLIDLHALPDGLRGSKASAGPLPEAEPTEDGMDGLPLPDSELSMREAKDQLINAFERRYLEDLLERCDGNVSKAARSAGVDRKTITRLLKRHNIR
ncbi:MAG: sigma 54-interacting transcriptional regulator [Alphaproteobacteria bacterium]|nr:sigma 54-interacting transcriptional regulator [Alphaproteobacteria bacterium]